MKRLTVRDVMTTDVVTAEPDASFGTLATLLTTRRLNALPVVSDGTLVGIVSMSDLLHKEAHKDDTGGMIAFRHRARESRHKAAGSTAAQLMTEHPAVIAPEATVVDAARTMTRKAVKQLPVLDEIGRLVGIVTRSDLIRAFLRPDEAIRADVEAELAPWNHVGTKLAVQVSEGIVTLTGSLERRSEAETVVRKADGVDGVIDVKSDLAYTYDDTVVMGPTF